MWLPLMITVLTGYLLGNLNGAVSMSILLSHQDVREHGSGNAGLTNFVRTFGGAKALLVFVIDMGKTFLACFVGKLLLEPYGLGMEGLMLGALAVSLGHDFPALLGFHGGKGILCGFTISLVADWRISLVLAAVFFAAVFATHRVSVGSVLGAASFCICFWVFYHDRIFVAICGTVLGLLAIFMHRANIARLCRGEEPPMSFGKKK